MTIELTTINLHPTADEHDEHDDDDEFTTKSSSQTPDLDHRIPIISTSSLTTFGAWNLYLSHALSTWNGRTYEFGATLFTASAFPHTLFAQSMRGLCTTFAALCLSSFVGRSIDKAPSRLRTLLITISANRASVLLACLGWLFLVPGPIKFSSTADLLPGLIKRVTSAQLSNKNSNEDPAPASSGGGAMKAWIFAAVIGLGICENLSGIGNIIAMEREWVPTLAATTRPAPSCAPQTAKEKRKEEEEEEQEKAKKSYTLTHLNAVTRRIDLLCKLFAPVFISVIILLTSMFVGVVVIGCTSTVSWGIEMWCAKRVWRTNPVLRRPKVFTISAADDGDSKWSWRHSIPTAFSRQISQLRAFFATDIWIPALSLTMLHFSVLAYSATFITFLLNAGFSLFLITSARVASSIVEVSSTFIAPVSIKYLAAGVGAGVGARPGGYFRIPFTNFENKEEPTTEGEGDDFDEQHGFLVVENEQDKQDVPGNSRNKDKAHLVGLARSGLWGISLQLACLVPVVLAIVHIDPTSSSSSTHSSLLITIPMFTFLCLSRLGLWVFDISIQELSQLCVPADRLASFAGTSMSFVAFFVLCQWVLVAAVSRPEQFVWVAGSSAVTVGAAGGMYCFWFVRRGGRKARAREERWVKGGGKVMSRRG